MKHAFKTLAGVAAAMSIVVAAGTASAADADAKCHQTIAKTIGKYQAGLAKAVVGCHKSRTGQKILPSVDCNDTDTNSAGADQKGKRSANRSKAQTKIFDTCNGLAQNVLPLYTACPS